MALTTVNPALLDTQAQYTGFKNRIINGAMVIDQRNAGSATTPTTAVYTVDRWQLPISQVSKITVQQNAGSVTPPAGFSKYLGLTVASAATISAADYFVLQQPIEGFNTADLNFGTSNASTFTLSFWVRSSVTGTFGGAYGNNANNRSYTFTYTINAANTWEQKTLTITGDTTGTWATDNNIGIVVRFSLGMGSTFLTTAGAWTAGSYYSTSGATNWVTNAGATFYITGVQLEKGSTATSFDYRPYGTELALCQRYYQTFYPAAQELIYNEASTANAKWWQLYLPAPMRSAPTATYSSGMTGGIVVGLSGTISSLSLISASVNRVSTRVTMSTASGTAYNVHHCDGFDGDSVGLASEL